MDEESRDDRVSLAGLDPEEALRALLKVDPDAPAAEPRCPKTWQGKSCLLEAGHLGPCQFKL